MGVQADMRAAAVAFLRDYATDAGVRMQVYPARPASINPPTGFVDILTESLDHSTLLTRRSPIVSLVVVHGVFDSKNAADQKDAFVDGIIEWSETRYHQAGANTLVAISDTEDLPNYVPEWLPPQNQVVYYATRLSMEGFASG